MTAHDADRLTHEWKLDLDVFITACHNIVKL